MLYRSMPATVTSLPSETQAHERSVVTRKAAREAGPTVRVLAPTTMLFWLTCRVLVPARVIRRPPPDQAPRASKVRVWAMAPLSSTSWTARLPVS